MLDLALGYFRKSVFKTYRYFKHPRKLKKNPLLRWFSLHFLDKRVWRPTRHTFAGGLAVGMLVMMQLIPGQMFFAVVLAAILRVNIPIAIVACWITNPVTMVPAAILQISLGNWIMAAFGHVTIDAPDFEAAQQFVSYVWDWLSHAGVPDSTPPFGVKTSLTWIKAMLIGGGVGGLILAGISYMISYSVWGLIGKYWVKKHPVPVLIHPPTSVE